MQYNDEQITIKNIGIIEAQTVSYIVYKIRKVNSVTKIFIFQAFPYFINIKSKF